MNTLNPSTSIELIGFDAALDISYILIQSLEFTEAWNTFRMYYTNRPHLRIGYLPAHFRYYLDLPELLVLKFRELE